jgi:serine phosphatase RsbU (regulator of sigma subunit)
LKARNTLDKIERDLDIAREIQRGLLPQRNPDVPNYEIMGWSRPADQTGGDYFDWMPLPDGRILVAIADVSGHGIGPALIAAVCRAYIRGASLGIDMALASAIERVNELLHLDIPEDRFVTAAVAVLNPDDDELTLVSAGQAPLFFYRAATKDVENWPADDLPLGIAGGMKLNQARTVEFQMGDTLILPTDGFFEWQNDAGEQYGIKRLGEFVQTHAHEPSEQFVAGLHADVIRHAKGIDQTDDITIVVIKRKAASPSLSRVV